MYELTQQKHSKLNKLSSKTRKLLTRRNFGKYFTMFLMALPGIAHIVLFKYVTLPYALIAFKNFRAVDGLWGSQWVGLKNFNFLFGMVGKGWQMVRNVVLYNTAFIILGTLIGLALAVFLAEVYGSKMSKFYQTSLFFPQFISWVIISFVGYAFLHKSNGMINGVLTSIGQEPINWYNSPQYWPVIITLTHLWRNLGMSTVVYLAGILRINTEYFEAASIDGASKWQQVIYITIPSLVPLISVLTLLSIGSIFFADPGLFYQVPRQYVNPALIKSTEVIDTYVLRALRGGGQLELAAAAGVYQSVVGFIMVVVANWVVRKIDPESALF